MLKADNLLAGKRVIITAGGSGIGAAMAKTFSAVGAKVAICDLDDSRFEALIDQRHVLAATKADVSDIRGITAFVEGAAARLGGLDILVNNAGIAGPNGHVEDLDPEEWDKTITVDLSSAFYCSRAAIPFLKQQVTGSIVNIASSAAFFGYPLRSPYAAAKWGLIGLTKTMAMELGPHQIRVNAICPGSVSGDRIDRVMAGEAKSRGITIGQVKESYTRHTSLKTFVEKEDVANMALFLVSELGAKISGQVLGVDGHTEALTQY
ncbi:SDR family oxidoreductase [Paremcibacter congregatus]|uniref:SDR family oxidoreductase n=1 Tax=Paremcibacter congregatus TaxID=2043170 RepID=UPI003A912860